MDSKITGYALVGDRSIVDKSIVSYNAKVLGNSLVQNSYVGGSSLISGKAICINSGVFNQAVITDESVVYNSVITNLAVISGRVDVSNSFIGGQVTITGTARLFGLELENQQYLIEGYWKRNPVHLTTSSIESLFGVEVPLAITEGIEDKWTIGCTSYPYDFWFRHSRLFQKLFGLNDFQVWAYKEALALLAEHRDINYGKYY